MFQKKIDDRSSLQKDEDYIHFEEIINDLSFREQRLLLKELIRSDPDSNSVYDEVCEHNIKDSLKAKLSFFNESKLKINNIIRRIRSNQLSEDKFEWFRYNIRAQLFVYKFLYKICFIVPPSKNNCLHSIYNYFDNPKIRSETIVLAQQVQILQNAEIAWMNMLESDNYTKWLKEEDIDKIKWTRNYLENKRMSFYLCSTQEPIRLQREYIFGLFDSFWYRDIDSVLLVRNHLYSNDSKFMFIDKMKKAWNQQKYRNEGKTKKPYHLPLTKTTKKKLDKMAEVNGLSTTAMLDILINSEYDLKYTDSDGNALY